MRGYRDGTMAITILILCAFMEQIMAFSDVKLSLQVTEPSPSGPHVSGLNLNSVEKKHQEKSNGLSRAENDYISDLVKNVTKAREYFESSGMSGRILAERLEALQNYSQASTAATSSKEESADVVCPPPGFKTVIPFSLKDYISGKSEGNWF